MPALALADAIRINADADPNRPSVTDSSGTITRGEASLLVETAAWHLQRRGVAPGDIVAMSGPNSARLLLLFFAVWRAGATPLPLHSRRSEEETIELLSRASPVLAIDFSDSVCESTAEAVDHVRLDELFVDSVDVAPVPASEVSEPVRIGVSGGSTGTSKLISVDVPAIVNPARPWHYQLAANGTHVVPLDIVDGTCFVAATAALALGCHLVLMDEFDAVEMLRLIEHHQADWLALTQPAMVATAKLSDEMWCRFDLSSLRCMTHYSGGVADWAKRVWIDRLGADRVAESYGATDARGSSWITGDEWLERPGSVGRVGRGGEFGIFDEHGKPLSAGQLGHIYIRDLTGNRNFHYFDQATETLGDGWESVGDMGWMDADEYLYIADRANDMINTESGMVAPLPIEGALEYHPNVRSALVIGLPASAGFEVLHAIVDAPLQSVTPETLARMLEERFPELAIPESWGTAPGPLRDAAGKARRRSYRAERT
jgi:bile acid-coenzyme A ligase